MQDHMPSVMEHNFSTVPHADIPRSSFNRSHGLKTTLGFGDLIPVYVDEVLPGDTFNMSAAAFGRLATPIHAPLDNMFIETFFFFVPNRLLWENWKQFNGQQDSPGDSTDFLIPVVTTPVGGYIERSLFDHFGIPTKEDIEDINALHSRAYNLIWNRWFRDQNLQDEVIVDLLDGPDDSADYDILQRGKRHDYFTSCLPFAQKGDPVQLSLGTSAPITGVGKQTQVWGAGLSVFETDGTGSVAYADASNMDNFFGEEDPNNAGFPNIRVNLSAATASTINELRQAFQIQKLFERDARGGTRYTEIIRAHFGVTSPDARLQRPEYLGGGSQRIGIMPVPKTNSSVGGNPPQGEIASYGTLSFQGHGFNKSFTEHGVIIGMVCARADLNYQQGINRMWTRQTRLEFYWPALAHIGEQAVLSKEIFADGSAADQDVFGFQERYAEYRYKPSQITGIFRSNATASLDAWHLAQDFATRPLLDSDFIAEDPPVDRIIAVPAEPHLLLDMYFNLKCARPMPTYGIPGLVDHF